MMCLLAVGALHAETFVMADQSGLPDGSTDSFTMTFGTYTMTGTRGAGTTSKPTYVGSEGNKDIRIYATSTLQLTTTGDAMTQIVFNISAQGKKRLANITASNGSVSVDNTNWTVTWTGSSKDVTLTVGEKATYGTDGNTKAGQLDFLSLDINTGSAQETVANPTISPAAGIYYSPVNVTINCGTQGATIYYTTNGTTPTASSTAYTAPFTVSTNTTVKAIAIKGSLQSSVVEAAYEFGTATNVANIAAYQAVEDGTVVKFTNPVNVLAQYTLSSGNVRLFVKDNTGYMFIFGKAGKKYNNGDIIPAGFTGTKTTFNGEAELSVTATSNFQDASGNNPISPETIQVEDVEADMFAHYVYIAGATLGYTTNSSGSKYLSTISDNSGDAAANNSMGMSIGDWDATYNVTAVIGSFDTDSTDVVYQVWPVKLEKVGGGTITDGVATIAEYLSLAAGKQFTFTGNAVVTYVDPNDKRYLYIKDNTGSALIYGTNAANNLKQGDVLKPNWTGKTKNYNGLLEIESPSGLEASGQTQTVTPVEKTLTDVTTANQNIYCVLRNVTIQTVTGRGFNFSDGTAGYNNFNNTVTLPTDLPFTSDMEGVISVNNNKAQFIPTRFLSEVTTPHVANIAELFTKDSGKNYEIDADITAIYQNGNNLYVKDANDTYTLVYGYLSTEFNNGDIIRGAQAAWTEYNNAKQLTPVGSTFVVAESGSPAQPEVLDLEELSEDHIHMYVKLEGITLVNDSTNYATATDAAGNSIIVFNKFNRTVTMAEDGTTDIIGFISLYKGNYQIYPIEFGAEPQPEYPRGDVDGNYKVDISDVNAAINIILELKTPDDYPGNADIVGGDGKVDISDVNEIINIILAS